MISTVNFVTVQTSISGLYLPPLTSGTKNLPTRAQTTPDGSFGPFLVVSTLHVMYFVVYNLYIQ